LGRDAGVSIAIAGAETPIKADNNIQPP